jgi:4-hydroxythreonine-4-phosphate dehydrogenase
VDALGDPRQRIDCLWDDSVEMPDVTPCQVGAAGGQAAFEAIVRATDLALTGAIHGITTAPINKASLHAAGHRYPGHTELLAERCGVEKFAMMLHVPANERIRGPAGLNIAHVTLHTSMRNALDQITVTRVVEAGELVDAITAVLLQAAGHNRRARIGVCALNPHAGEDGLFGDEERTIIGPAVAQLQQANMDVAGPFPSDTLISRAAAGEFDGVVAMYHDQGHIAVKLLEMYRAVNITLGLPIVRTSVAHGTAFDRAWQGTARHEGLIQAVRVCAMLSEHSRIP